MQNLLSFLFIAYTALSSSICFGQSTSILANENGLVLQYKKLDKIGSRYDEYCKTTFDIYQVEGTVINNNSDKAAMVTAILSFEGQACNKIYSNDGPPGGEVINKLFNLDIAHLTKHQTQYWVNRFVHLLPNDNMVATGYVEVKQGEQVPEPSKYFTYELIPSKGNETNSKTEGTATVDPSEKTAISTTGEDNHSKLIVGTWTITEDVYVYKDGKEVQRGELFQSFVFRADGSGRDIGNGEEYDFKYFISGNKINLVYNDGEKSASEIVRLDGSILIFKFNFPDEDNTGIASQVSTFKKEEK
ncbi:lipocalin family protein [Sphingobacterium sp. SRCM116780]|uniref:lipocalin family protein n=1 Tax=Sphingobacterium sp. SRCM116780 TaxID=2907623 RepID=UPI001F1B6A1D|nr:lipocalin family protein [Sphingobacterium sp. SRCM116780]UIR56873.1 lipocalin family protein [Sphingobacterium sp. SRCM116780]